MSLSINKDGGDRFVVVVAMVSFFLVCGVWGVGGERSLISSLFLLSSLHTYICVCVCVCVWIFTNNKMKSNLCALLHTHTHTHFFSLFVCVYCVHVGGWWGMLDLYMYTLYTACGVCILCVFVFLLLSACVFLSSVADFLV